MGDEVTGTIAGGEKILECDGGTTGNIGRDKNDGGDEEETKKIKGGCEGSECDGGGRSGGR